MGEFAAGASPRSRARSGHEDIKPPSVRLVGELLAASGLAERAPLFAREEIDVEAFMMMDEAMLQRLGLRFGPRAKILKLIKQIKLGLSEDGDETAAGSKDVVHGSSAGTVASAGAAAVAAAANASSCSR